MPAVSDPAEAAEAAGLRYVSPDSPGIARRRRGRGFSYLTASGKTLSSAPDRERIEALVIPPAWEDVWICPHADGHVQAAGRDDRGRRQYLYHPRWREVRDAEKFDQLLNFGGQLGKIRRQVAADLGRRGLPRERVIALVVRLLDETLIRIGNPQYARDESFGLTTLETRHVQVDGSGLVLDFEGKGGIQHEVSVTTPALVRMVRACDDLGGERLFTYDDGDEAVEVRSDDVNEYLRDIAGPDTTARDFRTWGGTVAVVGELGPVDPAGLGSQTAMSRRFLEAVDVAAERLGNTRTVCRGSYVHPAVEPAFESGTLKKIWLGSRRTKRLTRPEKATLRLLEECDPLGRC